MSKVMLISPSRNYPMGNEQYPSGALLLLGTMLKQHGHEVRVIHMVADRKTTEDIRKDIATFHPDIVGFTVTTYQTKMTKVLSAMVKSENEEITTVAGGAHPSALKGEFLKDFPNIDVSVYGEGEMAVMSLANNLRLSSTKGICYRTNGNGNVIVNPPGNRIMELDVLPMPNKNLIDFGRYAGLFPVGRRPCMFIMSSRGCPYSCLPSSEHVLLTDGSTKSIADIRLQDEVVSMDKSGHLTTSCVVASRRTPARSDIMRISTEDGDNLKCTSDHRVLTSNGWKEAIKLKVGDLVVKQRKIQTDERWYSSIGIHAQSSTTSDNTPLCSNRAREGNSPTTTLKEQSYEKSSHLGKESSGTTIQRGSTRACTPENATEQPNETTRNTGQGQRQHGSLQQDSRRPLTQIARERKNCSSCEDDRATKSGQRENEEEQPYESKSVSGQGGTLSATEISVQPKELSGEMVSKESRTKPDRSYARRAIAPTRIQICRRREVLDWSMPEWEVSQPRLSLAERTEQDSSTLQFGFLAQPTNCKRCRDDDRLRDARLESICNHREYAEDPPRNNKSTASMVVFSAITSITTCNTEDVFDIETYPYHNFIASGFVVHNCSFCSKSVFGSRLQQRSPENIVEEIGLLYRYWGVREVHFGDDTFNANLGWAHRLLDLVVAKGYNKKLVFRVALRVNKKIINADLLRHLKEAGVWFIYYGVESGNQKMLDRMHKGITIEEVKRAFKMTHDFGIRTEAFFIVGLPGETVQTIQDSRDLYKEIKPWWGGFSKAMPFPDTALTREVTEKGHLLCGDYDQLNPSRMVVRTDEMTAEELDRWADKLNKMTRMGKLLKVRQMRYLVTDQLKSVISEKIWTKPGGSI